MTTILAELGLDNFSINTVTAERDVDGAVTIADGSGNTVKLAAEEAEKIGEYIRPYYWHCGTARTIEKPRDWLAEFQTYTVEEWSEILSHREHPFFPVQEAANWFLSTYSAEEILDTYGPAIYSAVHDIAGLDGEHNAIIEARESAKQRLEDAKRNASLCGIIESENQRIVSLKRSLHSANEVIQSLEQQISDTERRIDAAYHRIDNEKENVADAWREKYWRLQLEREESRWIGIAGGVYVGSMMALFSVLWWLELAGNAHPENIRNDLGSATWLVGGLVLPMVAILIYGIGSRFTQKKLLNRIFKNPTDTLPVE